MKKGYKRLLFLELFLISILLVNNFVSGILSGYIKVVFLLISLVVFRLFFDFEKDRHRYWQSICLEVLIFLLAYFIIYYLSGLIFTFYKPPVDYYSWSMFIKYILPLILSIVLTEVLRYFMVCKAVGSKLMMVITCILFILIDLTNVFDIETFKTPYTIFMFMAISLLPAISKNILCTYMSLKVGFKPVLIYVSVMGLYMYLIPIIPNPNQYIYALLQLIAPFILLYRVYVFFSVDRDEDVLKRSNKHKIITLIPSALLMVVLAYFTCGYFHYHAVVIGSGSMTPKINKGDVVIIEKITDNYDDLKIGDVIAVKNEGIIIVHRLVKKIIVENEVYFYTKGDANNGMDDYKVSKDMIYGVVNKRIPYIGIPTVWLKNL